MESQDLGKASQPAYRAGSPPYKQALRIPTGRRQSSWLSTSDSEPEELNLGQSETNDGPS